MCALPKAVFIIWAIPSLVWFAVVVALFLFCASICESETSPPIACLIVSPGGLAPGVVAFTITVNVFPLTATWISSIVPFPTNVGILNPNIPAIEPLAPALLSWSIVLFISESFLPLWLKRILLRALVILLWFSAQLFWAWCALLIKDLFLFCASIVASVSPLTECETRSAEGLAPGVVADTLTVNVPPMTVTLISSIFPPPTNGGIRNPNIAAIELLEAFNPLSWSISFFISESFLPLWLKRMLLRALVILLWFSAQLFWAELFPLVCL
ncbi:hypothetical protein MYTO111405_04120 [Mycoplasma todarodis]